METNRNLKQTEAESVSAGSTAPPAAPHGKEDKTMEYGLGVADALRHSSPGLHAKECPNCILILEDYDAIRALMSRHFEREGFTVYSASSPHDASIIARAIHPLIVIVDYDLSYANSLDALRELRQLLPHSIIILSGGVDTSSLHDKAKLYGATELLVNGYDLTTLDRLISQARY
jgi:CheY-like chemotaxis protein